MARQHAPFVLIVLCFMASILAGLAGRERAGVKNSSTSAPSSIWSQVTDFASVIRQKLLDYAGSEESLIFGTGLLVATLTVCGLYAVSRCVDPEPFLYNNGKMGKLEANSAYNPNKKTC